MTSISGHYICAIYIQLVDPVTETEILFFGKPLSSKENMSFLDGEKRIIPQAELSRFRTEYRKLSRLLKIKNTKLVSGKVDNIVVVYLEKRKTTEEADPEEDDDIKILMVQILLSLFLLFCCHF